MTKKLLILALTLTLATLAFGQTKRHGVGITYDLANLDSDDLPDAISFDGFTIFFKIGFTDNWGLFLDYRDMNDDEDLAFGEEDSYTEYSADAVYMWRPAKKVRPHVKFGLAYVDAEGEIPGFVSLSDNNIGLSFGGGFEAGSPRVAFFLDYEAVFVELFDADTFIGDLGLGIVFKF